MGRKKLKQKQVFTPNKISRGDRITYIILSSILLIYGLGGFIIDDLYIPGKRGKGFHIHGIALYIMLCAFMCAIANLISIVIDHYDKRDNEISYKKFAKRTEILGWIFAVSAFLADLFLFIN